MTKEQLLAFETQMRQANVKWLLVFYSGGVHSFTNPESGNDPSQGVAYKKSADERSWQAMKQFFRQMFQYK